MTLGNVGFAVQVVFHFFLWPAATADGSPCLQSALRSLQAADSAHKTLFR
jgi:hypothetical protein